MIVQNFRAKPGTRMAAHPEPSLEEHLWTIAAARLAAARRRRRAGAAEPRLRRLPAPARRGDRRLGRRLARSRSTTSTPRRRGPSSSGSRRRRARAGSSSRRACRSTRATSAGDWLDPAVLPPALRASDALGLAREDGWHPGERGARAVRRRAATRCRSTRATSSARTSSSRLFRARGEERQRVFAAADRLRREVCGDEVTYVVTRNIQYTNVCYFRCGFCAFSKGKLAANLRGAPYLVPLDEIVRRVARGVGARRDRGLPAGRHPSGLHRRLLRLGRRGDQGRAARPARPRVLGARGLAGRRDARPAARGLPRAAARRSASARCRARPPRSSTTRCARSSAPTRSRPSSGSRCTTPRTGSACART